MNQLSLLVILPSLILSTYPVAIFHGLGDLCLHINSGFAQEISKPLNGTYVKCIESGESVFSIVGMSFEQQAEEACENLKKDENFRNKEISVLGLSQGGLIARYIAQKCDFGGKVRKIVSIGGPQMGVSMIPQCSFDNFLCRWVNTLTGDAVYFSYAQKMVGPAGYYRDQYDMKNYLAYSTFLADLNNEKSYNDQYKQNLLELENFTLIMFKQDTMIVPKETAVFGFYKENSLELQPLFSSEIYLNDTLGLKILSQQGKLHFEFFEGNHLQFGKQEINSVIIPALI